MSRKFINLFSATCLIVLFVFGASAPCQTANFSGFTTTLASNVNVAQAVAVDNQGNVYIASGTLHSIEELLAVNGKLPPNPAIRYLGSGLADPRGLALDKSGNLFIADLKAPGIKEFLAVNGTLPDNPVIRTLGSGFASPHGVAVDSSGNVYVADDDRTTITKLIAVNGNIPDNPQTSELGSGFRLPRGVTVDSAGDVFVADSGHGRVWRIDAITGGLSEVRSGFHNPQSVAIDSVGNLFVTDTTEGLVKEAPAAAIDKYDQTTPPRTVGNGFSVPKGLAVDSFGNVYVADFGNSSIMKIDLAPSVFADLAVGTVATSTVTFNFTDSVTIETPAVVTQGAFGLDYTDADTGSCTTQGVSHAYSAGDSCTVDLVFKPTRPGVRYGAAFLKNQYGQVLASANLFGTGIGPQVNYRPGTQSTLGTLPSFIGPVNLTIDGSGNVFFANYLGDLYEMPAENGILSPSPKRIELYAGLNVAGLAVDGNGNIDLACDGYVLQLVTVNAGTPSAYRILNYIADEGNMAYGVVGDRYGNVFFADDRDNTVKEVVAVNGIIPSFNQTIRVIARGFAYPQEIAIDANGNLFVADYFSGKIKEIVAVNGQFPDSPTIRELGSGFQYPTGVAVDVEGNVFVGDYGTHKVFRIVAVNGMVPDNPVIETLADSSNGFISPYGLFLDKSGNLYVADNNANKITKLDYADPPTLNFAQANVGQISADSPKSLTLFNSGNADLNFTVPVAGSNPMISPGFYLADGGTCPDLNPQSPSPSPLAPGASCNENVGFKPLTAGTASGSLVFVDNNLNNDPALQTLFLTGNQSSPAQTPSPVISPSKGTFNNTVLVTIAAQSTVYYTTDGSTPNNTSPVYNGPIPVTGPEAIKAVAIATGLTPSAPVVGTYSFRASTPAFSPVAGSYTGSASVTITDSTDGAAIYYTTDGSTPTQNSTLYTGPVVITSTAVLQAIAIKPRYTNSAIKSGNYSIR